LGLLRYARDQDLAFAEYQEVQELWQASKKALEVERTRLEREAEAERKRSHFRAKIIGALVLAAVLLTITLVWAEVQRRRADSELKKAETTQSLYLASVARGGRAEGDVGTALLLAIEALSDSNGIARPYVGAAMGRRNRQAAR